MSPPRLQPASEYTLEALTTLLNGAFSDYALPMELSDADVSSMIVRDDVLLQHSWIASLDGRPVALALYAQRAARSGITARLATIGVLPEARRSGVGRLLLRREIDEARANNARTLCLEVLASNLPARRLYETHGFVARRRLLGFTLHDLPPTRPDLPSVSLQPVDSLRILALRSACCDDEPLEAQPPWQLADASLARYGPPSALYTIMRPPETTALGYLVLGASRPYAGLVHIGILPDRRRQGLATAALATARQISPEIEGYYLPPLVPEASTLVPFLRQLGAVPDVTEQIEMLLTL